jgi:hypothetical protein
MSVEQHLFQMETKYGGMDASSLRRLKELEEENRRLKAVVC